MEAPPRVPARRLPVIGLGTGGHARVMIEILRLDGRYELAGLLDPRPEVWHTDVLGVPVLGGDDRLPELYRAGIRCAFVGVGSVPGRGSGAGRAHQRRLLYERLLAEGFEVVAAIHPAAVISPSAALGAGPTVMALACINAGARLGDDVTINTGAIVEHDCVLGDHVHVAPGARLASAVQVGAEAHIGLGAAVLQSVRIGRRAVVGAGAVVVHDVPDGAVVAGVPARILRSVGQE
jgi:UDP-perosamine 4-acetyltransferase